MLRLDGLHKRCGDVAALDGCSFSVRRGQLLGFLGPNGAGKTTAMRSVFGLIKPDSGSVTWADAPITPDRRPLVVGFAFVAVSTSTDIELPTAAAAAAVAVVLWFVLGFVFYATAYAAAGSLVSRQEEAQNAAFPLTLLMMAGYFVASFSFTGENPVLRVASLLTPSAPMTMPIRMAGGDAALWEIALSATLMVAATYLTVRLAGRVSAGGLLRTGQKVRLRDAWRSARA